MAAGVRTDGAYLKTVPLYRDGTLRWALTAVRAPFPSEDVARLLAADAAAERLEGLGLPVAE